MPTLNDFSFKEINTYMDDLMDHIRDKTDGKIMLATIVVSVEDEAVSVISTNESKLDNLLRTVLEHRMEDNPAYQKYRKKMEDTLKSIGL